MSPAPYTSSLAGELAPGVLDRFLRYVQIDTQSKRDQSNSPSTPGQLDLGRVLVAELQEAGLADAQLDDNGYVTATLDGAADAPVVGLLAHMDTSPDAPGAGVRPVVHRDYDGGVLELPTGGTRLDPEALPALAEKVGHDIVSASGDTLLGADDKAGVAEIMAAVAYLAAHPERPRPRLRIAFTPDEEVGRLAGLLDLDRFGAVCAYTLDGSELGELQNETFSAYEAIVTFSGVDAHPGDAYGKLVNAVRLASKFVAALPADRLTPETTREREGYIHPHELAGDGGRASVRLILRDFDDELLERHLELLRATAAKVAESEPRASLDVSVTRQYSNMRVHLDQFPRAMEAAEEAIRAEGLEPRCTAIRGGTDGAALSERGLPTPNLFTGGHDFHSPREWASVQDMAAAAATIVRLAGVWADGRGTQ